MARPPKYDCADVLGKATRLFWDKGYRGVSVNDLVASTGLLPGSLYARFGNKEGVFLECLQHYGEMVDRLRADLSAQPSPLARIRAYFTRVVDRAASASSHRGCFLVNAVLECDEDEPRIRAEVRTLMGRDEAWFRAQLDEAVAVGELSAGVDTARLATCLMGSSFGLKVMARAEERPERLKSAADAMFDGLVKPWLAAGAK